MLCVVMALLNVALIFGGIAMQDNAAALAEQSQSLPAFWEGYGQFLILSGAVFGVLNLLVPFLPKRPWAYMVHLGNILSACLFCCPAAMAIPILVFWLRPDVRTFFGMK